MPNATFTADFNDFIGQSQKAEASLGDVATRAEKTQAALDKMTGTAPAGIRSIATETNTVSNEMSGMIGIATSVAGALGAVWSVDAAMRFAGAVIEDASALEKMAQRTGITVEGLQTLRTAGDDAGNTLDQIGNAINVMQRNLAGGSSSVLDALAQLNIKFSDIRGQAPEAQFITIGEAIAKVKDPAEQVALSVALMGRQGAEILPTLKTNFEQVGDSANQMSTQTVKALAEVGNEWKRLKTGLQADAGTALAFLFERFRVVDDSAEAFNRTLEQMGKTAAAAAPNLAPEKLAPPGLPKDLAAIEKAFDEDAKAIDRLAAAAARDFDAIVKHVHDIEGVVSHADEGLLNLSASEQKATQRLFDTYLRGYDSVAKADAALQDDIAKHTLSSTDYQIREITRRVQAEEAGFQGTLEQRVAFNAATEALAQRQTDSLIAKAKEVEAAERAAAEAMLTVVVGHGPDVPNAGAGRVSGNLAGTVVPADILAAVAGMSSTSASLEVARMMKLRGLSFQEGGRVQQSGLIYAHKGEYVEPVGGGRGMIVNITNYITQPFGSPDAIGRAIGESTVQGLKNRGIRFPTGA